MTAQELRIGNWVLEDNKPLLLDKETMMAVLEQWREDDLAPIPLTPEILEKSGFVGHIDTGNEFYIIGDFALHKTDSGFLHNACADSVDNLHQLQNLYFALTGTELEINL